MVIRWRCECGKSLKAKPEAAGRRLKCPNCGTRLTVPTADAAGDAVSSSPTVKNSSTASAPADASPDDDEFRLAPETVEESVRPTKQCPQCQATMAEEAIACIECGYSELDERTPAYDDDAASVADGNPRAESGEESASESSIYEPAEEENPLTPSTIFLAILLLNVVLTIVLVVVAGMRHVKYYGSHVFNINLMLILLELTVAGLLVPAVREAPWFPSSKAVRIVIFCALTIIGLIALISFGTHMLFMLGIMNEPIIQIFK